MDRSFTRKESDNFRSTDDNNSYVSVMMNIHGRPFFHGENIQKLWLFSNQRHTPVSQPKTSIAPLGSRLARGQLNRRGGGRRRLGGGAGEGLGGCESGLATEG